jgi:hypothetical protein
MKNKKRNIDGLQVLRMPDPAGFKKLADEKDEKEDPVEKFATGQLEEKLIEEIGNRLDEHFELTGEPITATLLMANHISELSEIIGKANSNNNIKTVVIKPSRQHYREDEDEIFR